MLTNTENSYGLITKSFHWLLALLIIAMLIIGYIMTDMTPSEQKWQLYFYHKSTGFVIFILVILRFIWRLNNVSVLPPKNMPYWQILASKLTHYILYILMFLMPFTGVMMTRLSGRDINIYNLFTIPAAVKNSTLAGYFHKTHTLATYAAACFIILHISASLYHNFIRKDNILKRMI